MFSPTIEYSNNWAGHIMPQAAVGNANFYGSLAYWTQPQVPGDSHYSNYQNAPDASFWTGIGVYQLVQAGADSIATSTPTYRFWTEDYPLGTVWEGPAIHPGDQAFVSVNYTGSLSNNSGGQAYYWLEDETTGQYSSFTNSAPYPGWRAANFINERLGNYYLPNFNSNILSYAGASDNNGDFWALETSNNDRMYMTRDGTSSGTIMSDPGAVNNDTNGFTDYWRNKGPY